MKYLDRLINFIFSLAILIISGVIILITAGFMEFNVASDYLKNTIFSAENNTITCITSIIVFLAALKTTIFLSKTNTKKKAAIMVDTTNGKIQIASDTIENTAKNVAKNYDEVKDVQVKMVKEKRAVTIYMVLLVLPRTNIIELSSKVQDAVKEAIQNTTGVKVNNVDIKIKNIADKNKASKGVKEEIVIPTKTAQEKTQEVKVEEKIEEQPVEVKEPEIIEEKEPQENKAENSEENKNV